jgi:hypothetical protein
MCWPALIGIGLLFELHELMSDDIDERGKSKKSVPFGEPSTHEDSIKIVSEPEGGEREFAVLPSETSPEVESNARVEKCYMPVGADPASDLATQRGASREINAAPSEADFKEIIVMSLMGLVLSLCAIVISDNQNLIVADLALVVFTVARFHSLMARHTDGVYPFTTMRAVVMTTIAVLIPSAVIMTLAAYPDATMMLGRPNALLEGGGQILRYLITLPSLMISLAWIYYANGFLNMKPEPRKSKMFLKMGILSGFGLAPITGVLWIWGVSGFMLAGCIVQYFAALLISDQLNQMKSAARKQRAMWMVQQKWL